MSRTAVCLTVIFASIFLRAPQAHGRYLMEMGVYNLHPYVRGSWGMGDISSIIDQGSQNWWGASQIPRTSEFGQQGWNNYPLPSGVYSPSSGSRHLWRGYMDENNLYGYAAGSPVKYVDPSGLLSDEWFDWGWPSAHDYGAYFWPWGGNEEIDPIFGIPGDRVQGGAIITAGTAAAAAGVAACAEPILVEGLVGGNPLGKGGIFQLRPPGRPPWFRIDIHPIRPGGWPAPHIDAPPWGWHHWPWSWF